MLTALFSFFKQIEMAVTLALYVMMVLEIGEESEWVILTN